MSGYFNKTSPNSYGGTFGLTANTGGGVGNLHKHQASTPSGHWNMGDALSSPKGPYDYREEDDNKEEIDFKIEKEIELSLALSATDSLARSAVYKGSLGGIGSDMSGVLGLSAGKEIHGNSLLESYIKDYVKEVLLNEFTMSGNLAVKRSGIGSAYKIDNTTSHTNKLDNSSNQKSKFIDQGGYGQKARTPKGFEPYINPGQAVDTDGVKYMSDDSPEFEQLFDEENFEDKSTYEIMVKTIDKLTKDQYNFYHKNI